MELQLCPVCSWNFKDGQVRTVPYPTEPGKLNNKPKSIVFCGNCGVGVATPVWESKAFEKFYSEGGYWDNAKIEILLPPKYPVPYALAVARWKLIEPLFREPGKQISILDIGAGHGFLGMVAAKSKKLSLIRYVCVEKDMTLVESLKKTWAIYCPRIHLQVKDHIDQIDGIFDCVILSHILEHLPDPKILLHIVSGKLTEGGGLYIDVPNQDYLFKKDVFPHLLFFNIQSLKRLLEDCGLKIISIDSYGNDMNRSPLNFRNASKLRSLFVMMIMRTSVIFPESFIVSFFMRYFEMDKKSKNGIWIRTLCQRPIPCKS